MDQSHWRGFVLEDPARTLGEEDGELTTSGRNLLASDSNASCTSWFLKPNSIGEDTSSSGPAGRGLDPELGPEHHLAPPSLARRPRPRGARLRLRSDRNGGSAEQQNCLVSRMEVGLMADEGPLEEPSKCPA